jgi:LPXTG-motif cell wall-anchored protein
MLQQENLQTPLQALYKVKLNSMPALQVHSVQTSTKKDLFYLLAILMLGSSSLLFFIRRRFH